jgi:hypothetical protein
MHGIEGQHERDHSDPDSVDLVEVVLDLGLFIAIQIEQVIDLGRFLALERGHFLGSRRVFDRDLALEFGFIRLRQVVVLVEVLGVVELSAFVLEQLRSADEFELPVVGPRRATGGGLMLATWNPAEIPAENAIRVRLGRAGCVPRESPPSRYAIRERPCNAGPIGYAADG